MKGRTLTQHILYRANSIDRACYMLTDEQWEQLEEVSKILVNNDIKTDFVCGDTSAEGVQLDTDVLILEGTQIRNINVDRSRRFNIARVLHSKYPNWALQEFQNIVNLQTMIQSIFRGIDRNGKRGNFIVLLGNLIPYRKKCWIELAKKYFEYLNNENIRYVEINGRHKNDNEIKEIIEVITNKEYDFKLTPFENQIVRYIRSRPDKCVKQNILVKYFLTNNKVIRKGKQDIYNAIKNIKQKMNNNILVLKSKKYTEIKILG